MHGTNLWWWRQLQRRQQFPRNLLDDIIKAVIYTIISSFITWHCVAAVVPSMAAMATATATTASSSSSTTHWKQFRWAHCTVSDAPRINIYLCSGWRRGSGSKRARENIKYIYSFAHVIYADYLNFLCANLWHITLELRIMLFLLFTFPLRALLASRHIFFIYFQDCLPDCMHATVTGFPFHHFHSAILRELFLSFSRWI